MTTSQPAAGSGTIPYDRAMERLRGEQNLMLGIAGGAAAALAGAAAWAGVTVGTGYQIGWMAVGVGFLVGVTVRALGKGVDQSFGLSGALLSLLGCAAGNLFAMCGLLAQQEGVPFVQVVSQLTPGMARELMTLSFSPMDLLFYGIAVYEGYKFSIRPITTEDMAGA
ncbi:MAG TPA: hypothetical protein VJV23_05845 [Candidatus Polarisedimenticolia bacterium]|nr:hypothetical protein [Candidatus Polarisedimenticolia bacterium]